MTNFILYYDADATVHTVSPVPQDDLNHLGLMPIAKDIALKFMSGEENMSNWYVTDGPNGKTLVENPLDIVPANVGEIFQLPSFANSPVFMGLSATVFLVSDLIEFKIPSKLVGRKLSAVTTTELNFKVIKRNAPEFMYGDITVDLEALIKNGSVKVPLKSKGKLPKDIALLHERVLFNYRFEIQNGAWHHASEFTNNKQNNLVAYRPVDTVEKSLVGVLATHNVKRNTLSFKVLNDCDLSVPESSSCVIFLTKPRDPTLSSEMFHLDIPQLAQERKLEFKLPKNVGTKFGLGGYPIAKQLVFTRK